MSFTRAKEIYHQNNNTDVNKKLISEALKSNRSLNNKDTIVNNNMFYDQNQNIKTKMLNFTSNINKFKDFESAINCITDILKDIYNKPFK